jgi:hypothetical protein
MKLFGCWIDRLRKYAFRVKALSRLMIVTGFENSFHWVP